MLFSPVAGSISAQTPQEKREEVRAQFQENTEKYQENREEVEEKNGNALERRCMLATGTIDTWTNRYAENRNRFQKMEAKFQNRWAGVFYIPSVLILDLRAANP